MNRKFISPRMEIIDHYDSVINELDIYTEELLEKLAAEVDEVYTSQYFEKQDLEIQFSPSEIGMYINDRYSAKYNYERVENIPKAMTTKEYINKARAKAIEELITVRDENLKNYDANASRLRRDWSKMVDPEEREELRQELFGQKFCFGVEIKALSRTDYDSRNGDIFANAPNFPRPTFKFCTIVVDFYLNEIEIQKLK
jgi:hypothetical protein